MFEKAIISTASSSEKENNGEPNKNEEMILPKTFATPAFSDKRKVNKQLKVSSGVFILILCLLMAGLRNRIGSFKWTYGNSRHWYCEANSNFRYV